MESTAGLRALACSPAALEFAERWAALLKAVSMFPAGSQRVRDGVERALSALRRATSDPARANRDQLRLQIFGSELWLDDGQVAIRRSSNLDWMRERFERALLQGADFRVSLEGPELLAFSRQLLDHASRRQLDLTFEDLWRERFEHVAPRPLFFEGVFGDAPRALAASQRASEPAAGGTAGAAPAGAASGTAGVGAGQSLEVEQAREVSGLLAVDPGIERLVARISRRFGARPGEARAELDVVARIVRLLPSEDLASAERARAATAAALEALEEHLAGQAGGAAPDTSKLEELLRTCRHVAFARGQGPNAAALAQVLRQDEADSRPAYRARDDAIDGDLAAFAREYAELPALDTARAAAEMELPAEQMHAYLSALLQARQEPEGFEAYRPVAERLRAASPEGLAVLLDVLRAYDGEDRARAAGLRRLTRFLRASGLAHLARACGYLGADDVVAQFPRHFVLYLQGLDLSTGDGLRGAEDVCRRIGAARIREMAGRLVKQEDLLGCGLPERLLGSAARELAPLVRAVFKHGGDARREGVVRYLGHVCQGDPAACLLYLLDARVQLPPVYLDGLLERVEAGRGARATSDGGRSAPFSEALRTYVSAELCRLVERTREKLEELERRERAVQLLGTFRTPASRELLAQVVRGRRMVFLRAEPERIRRAAQQALDCY